MAEEFQGGVCGGNWCNLSRNIFGLSPCSLASNDAGSFGWPNHDLIMDMKATRSGDDSAGSATAGSSSILLHDVQKPQPQTTANGGMPVGSTLPLVGNTLSSPTATPHGWNPDFLHDGVRSDENYSNIPQEAAALNSGMNYRQETRVDFPQIHEDWSSNNISLDSSINTVKQVNQSFPLEHHQPLNSITSSSELSETLSAGFPLNSSSYGYTSSLLQTLFDIDTDQPKQSLSENPAMNYLSAPTNQANSNEFMPSLPDASPMVNPTLAKQQLNNHFPFSKNATLRNPEAPALSNVRGSFLPSAQPQLLSSSLNFSKHNFPSFNPKRPNEAARDTSSAAKKASNEPTVKRPRIQTPSPLPTFKVRKEKLGDRITALQQLVSPFGKTDTASVLHEAIEYIKFLHDQVSVLSAPYLKTVLHHQQATDNLRDGEGQIQDLKSAGLCLVPISVTFPVAADTTTDFWTPTFGGRLK